MYNFLEKKNEGRKKEHMYIIDRVSNFDLPSKVFDHFHYKSSKTRTRIHQLINDIALFS